MNGHAPQSPVQSTTNRRSGIGSHVHAPRSSRDTLFVPRYWINAISIQPREMKHMYKKKEQESKATKHHTQDDTHTKKKWLQCTHSAHLAPDSSSNRTVGMIKNGIASASTAKMARVGGAIT